MAMHVSGSRRSQRDHISGYIIPKLPEILRNENYQYQTCVHCGNSCETLGNYACYYNCQSSLPKNDPGNSVYSGLDGNGQESLSCYRNKDTNSSYSDKKSVATEATIIRYCRSEDLDGSSSSNTSFCCSTCSIQNRPIPAIQSSLPMQCPLPTVCPSPQPSLLPTQRPLTPQCPSPTQGPIPTPSTIPTPVSSPSPSPLPTLIALPTTSPSPAQLCSSPTTNIQEPPSPPKAQVKSCMKRSRCGMGSRQESCRSTMNSCNNYLRSISRTEFFHKRTPTSVLLCPQFNRKYKDPNMFNWDKEFDQDMQLLEQDIQHSLMRTCRSSKLCNMFK